MSGPINTGPGANINDDVVFNGPTYGPPCPPKILTEDSSSIIFQGSGSTCDPLTAFVKISSVFGNNIFIFNDGLYASGGTGGAQSWNDTLLVNVNTSLTPIQNQAGIPGSSQLYWQYTTSTPGIGKYNIFLDDSFIDGGGVRDHTFAFHSYNYPAPGYIPVGSELQYRFAVERKWFGTSYQSEFHIPEYVTTSGVIHRLDSRYVNIATGANDWQVEFENLKAWTAESGHIGNPFFAVSGVGVWPILQLQPNGTTQHQSEVRLYGDNTTSYNSIYYNISSGFTIEAFGAGNVFMHALAMYGPNTYFFNQTAGSPLDVVYYLNQIPGDGHYFTWRNGDSSYLLQANSAVFTMYTREAQVYNPDTTSEAIIAVSDGVGAGYILKVGSTYSGSPLGIGVAGNVIFESSGDTGMVIQTYQSTPIKFGINAVQVGDIKTTGQWQFNNYGSGTFTGTQTKSLSVDASGNIIEVPISINSLLTGFSPVSGTITSADTILTALEKIAYAINNHGVV